MDFIVDAKEIAGKLEVAKMFTARSGNLSEITKCVKILSSVQHNTVIIEACDFQSGCRTRIYGSGVEVFRDGGVVVDANDSTALLKQFKNEKVRFEIGEGGQLLITDEKQVKDEFSLPVVVDGLDKFPTILEPAQDVQSLKISKADFLRVAKQISYAAEKNETDEDTELMSRLIFFDGDLAFTTNTYKFAALVEDVGIKGLRLPKESLSFFNYMDEFFNIYVEDSIFYMQDDNFYFMFKVPECKMPNPRALMSYPVPEKIALGFKLNVEQRKELLAGIAQIEVLNPYVTFYADDKEFWIMGHNETLSANKGSLKYFNFTPKYFCHSIVTTYNTRYVKQALSHLSEPEMLFVLMPDGRNHQLNLYEGEFRALVAASISKAQTNIVNKIQEFKARRVR